MPSTTDESTQTTLPRGYHVDHHAPTSYIVRCSACGRRTITDDRGHAHRQASQHALHCNGDAGVTPIRPRHRPNKDDDHSPGELDPRHTELTGTDVILEYQSVQKRADCQRRRVTVTRMLPSEDGESGWLGFQAIATNGVTLRVTLPKEAVQTVAQGGHRYIGHLEAVHATTTPGETEQPVAADGGPSQ